MAWGSPELLHVKGPAVSQADMGRMIDPYLLEDVAERGKWWCFYKQDGVSASSSQDLREWRYEGPAIAQTQRRPVQIRPLEMGDDHHRDTVCAQEFLCQTRAIP